MPRNIPARNRRSSSTAAAFTGCIGLPDTGRGPCLHDGGWAAFARLVDQRFENLAATTMPELRGCARLRTGERRARA